MLTVRVYGIGTCEKTMCIYHRGVYNGDPSLEDVVGEWTIVSVDFNYGEADVIFERSSDTMYAKFGSISFETVLAEDDEVFALCEQIYYSEYYDSEYGIEADEVYSGTETIYLSRNIKDVIQHGIKLSNTPHYSGSNLYVKKIKLGMPIRYTDRY